MPPPMSRGRAESGERPPPVAVADMSEAGAGQIECLFPARFAKMRIGIGRVDVGILLGDALLADQRLGQPVGVVGVVEAKAAFDAEPVVVGWPVLSFDRDDAVV